MRAMGNHRCPPLTSCCAALFLTGRGLVPVRGPGPGGGGGLGTPALKDLRQSRNTWGRSNHKPQRKIFLQPGRWGAGDTDGAVTKPFAHDMTNSGLSSWIQVVIEK